MVVDAPAARAPGLLGHSVAHRSRTVRAFELRRETLAQRTSINNKREDTNGPHHSACACPRRAPRLPRSDGMEPFPRMRPMALAWGTLGGVPPLQDLSKILSTIGT